MTAAESEDVPISKIAGPKEPVAKITAVDVEPTAKPIKIPEIGAKKVPEIHITEIKWTICVDKSETEINPAIAPAPIKIKTVSVTLFKPEDA